MNKTIWLEITLLSALILSPANNQCHLYDDKSQLNVFALYFARMVLFVQIICSSISLCLLLDYFIELPKDQSGSMLPFFVLVLGWE